MIERNLRMHTPDADPPPVIDLLYGRDGTDAALTGVERVTDVAAAVADSMRRHGDPHVAFVPEGPYVVPVHAPGAGT